MQSFLQKVQMIFEVVQLKWSLTWFEPLDPLTRVLDLMNGQMLQHQREQLKVPGFKSEDLYCFIFRAYTNCVKRGAACNINGL